MGQTESLNAVAESIAAAGGTQVLLAEKLGVKQQAVSLWLKRGWVPLLRAKEIESLYGISRGRLVNPRIKGLVLSDGGDL